MKTTAPLVAACLLFATLPVAAQNPAHAGHDHAAMHGAADASVQLQAAVAGGWRNAANAARDPYRHPLQTLEFFGVQPQQTVIEITPGGGWYAEILAPYLRGHGRYVAAVVDPQALPAAVKVSNLWLAMAKSVVFGVFIALIGCHWGLRVKPNTQSLGEGTTASVVSAITMVIIVDAVFAVAFRSVGF